MAGTYLNLDDGEAFYTYHTLCTYLTGDYQPFRTSVRATEENVRSAASKIDTGADGVWLSALEAEGVSEAFCRAHRDTPVEFPRAELRDLAEKIYSSVPEEESERYYYGPNWPETREEVLERDGYECQKCGIGDEEHQQRRGHGLHIHHIVPRGEFGGYEAANKMGNLIALCTSCHASSEGDQFEEAELA